jgi:hypothetical protein
MVPQLLVGQGFLIVEASYHTILGRTPLVNDQPDVETSA